MDDGIVKIHVWRRAKNPEHIQGTYSIFDSRTTLPPGFFGFSTLSL
jgi:hypothetical protein